MRVAAFLALAVACGCGSSTSSEADAGGADAPTQRTCASLLEPRTLGVIEPIAVGLQIHPAIAFDGESLWLAYTGNDIDDMSVFDTFVLRLDCAGVPRGEAVRATTTAGRSEIDPAIAVGRDSVAVSWTSDTRGTANNLDIVVRTFGLDGVPTSSSDVTIEPTTPGGEPVVGNGFYSALAANASGGFVLAGSNVLPGAPTFRAFMQSLGGGGELVGPEIEVASAGPDTHSEVVIALDAAGTRWIAYTEAAAAGDVAMLASISAAGEKVVAPLFESGLSRTPAIAIEGSVRLVAASTEIASERDLRLIATDGTAIAAASFGTAGAFEHTPVIAPRSEVSGALAFFRNLGGFRNQLVVVDYAVDFAASTIAFGDAVEIEHEIAAPPYAPAIVHVADGIYLVVWAEGASPQFTLRGAFLEL